MQILITTRRRMLVFLVIFFSLAPLVASPAQQNPSSIVQGIAGVSMTVSDLDRSVEFYSKVLSFHEVSEAEVDGDTFEQLTGVFGLHMRVARMKLGDESIELVEYLAPKGRPIPVDSRSNDCWFQHIAIIVSDMGKAYAWLRKNHVEYASSAPQRLPDWNKNAAGIWAFYFKDPDGHPLEILQFPPDKGAEKWHQHSGNLFLGIDHTAITVSNTDASLHFYRDLLGMHVVGESENYGSEQEHLNNVFGAHLRITALRTTSGPGIELLEYLSPRDGRPYPADERANDLVHRHTILVTNNVAAAARALQINRVVFVSSQAVSDSHSQLGFKKAFLARDPDGHALEITEK